MSEGHPTRPEFQIRDLDHIVLRVKDIERALEFYTGVLGLGPHRVDEFRAGDVPFPCARVNDRTIIDLLPWPDEEPVGDGHRNLDHFCLAVDGVDMDEFSEYLASRGVEIDHDRTGRRSGAKGMADSIYVRDPDRNVIELRRY
ncbi:MAG: VOC family protein [Chloroflexi bacterium]|nr:VOC family protein [Chloroflexota bacterium]